MPLARLGLVYVQAHLAVAGELRHLLGAPSLLDNNNFTLPLTTTATSSFRHSYTLNRKPLDKISPCHKSTQCPTTRYAHI